MYSDRHILLVRPRITAVAVCSKSRGLTGCDPGVRVPSRLPTRCPPMTQSRRVNYALTLGMISCGGPRGYAAICATYEAPFPYFWIGRSRCHLSLRLHLGPITQVFVENTRSVPAMSGSTIQPDHAVFSYLRSLGYSERQIGKMTMNTRLYHDLGEYGDSAIEDMQHLADKFGVDLSSFEFARYFPPEFVGRNRLEKILISWLPFASTIIRSRSSYRPLTLGMIDQSIRAKIWRET